MAGKNTIEFTDNNFQKEVIDNDETPTLVDFTAVWCGPCRVVAPTVDALADEYKGKLKVGKLDIDHNQITAQKWQIRSVPTLMVFKGGRVVETIIGAQPRAKIEAKVTPHL